MMPVVFMRTRPTARPLERMARIWARRATIRTAHGANRPHSQRPWRSSVCWRRCRPPSAGLWHAAGMPWWQLLMTGRSLVVHGAEQEERRGHRVCLDEGLLGLGLVREAALCGRGPPTAHLDVQRSELLDRVDRPEVLDPLLEGR
jgi:hypothetical protein